MAAWALLHAPAGASGAAQAPRACLAAQLSVGLDDMGGWFNGMSHSGTLLVLRNLGPQACSVPAQPVLEFQDGQRQPIRLRMRHEDDGSARAGNETVAIPAEAEVTSRLRWVSGDAYGDGNCVAPAYIGFTAGTHTLWQAFGRRLCGPGGEPPGYTATPLRRDPAYVPAQGGAPAGAYGAALQALESEGDRQAPGRQAECDHATE